MEHFVRSALDDMNRLSDTAGARGGKSAWRCRRSPVNFEGFSIAKLPTTHNAGTTDQSGRVCDTASADGEVIRPASKHSELNRAPRKSNISFRPSCTCRLDLQQRRHAVHNGAGHGDCHVPARQAD